MNLDRPSITDSDFARQRDVTGAIGLSALTGYPVIERPFMGYFATVFVNGFIVVGDLERFKMDLYVAALKRECIINARRAVEAAFTKMGVVSGSE